MPLVADDADETEDPTIPWTIHVANAMFKVSSVLLNQLLSKRFFQMLVEWCDTPCQILSLTCTSSCTLVFFFISSECNLQFTGSGPREPGLAAKYACWKFVHSTLVPCSPSPSNNIYVSVDYPLTCPCQEGDVTRLREFLASTYWSNEAALQCMFAAIALVLHDFKRRSSILVQWARRSGSESDSTFRDHHRWVDMNVYYDDHEMRKQADLLAGALSVMGQESPDTDRRMG